MGYNIGVSDKASLRGKVFNTIREAILEGSYKPGDVLRESTIAAELGVSRTPVREAIRQLELEGLVQSIPNKETVVAGITQEDVEDIYLIRSRLEGLAARKAAERITEQDLQEMEEILALTSFYVEKNEVNQLKELDHKFHDIIYNATHSKTLNHMLSDFHSYIQQARKTSISTPGRPKEVLREHEGIYEALKARNGELAEKLVEKHIQNVEHNLHINNK